VAHIGIKSALYLVDLVEDKILDNLDDSDERALQDQAEAAGNADDSFPDISGINPLNESSSDSIMVSILYIYQI